MEEKTTQPSAQAAEMEESMSFKDLFEQSLTQKPVAEGEIVKGTILKVGKEFVVVDIGYKSEGQIPIHEFADERGQINIHTGDIVDVLVEMREDEDGSVLLSKEKADKMKIWDEISKACAEGEVVEGEIVSKVKGGLSVDIGVKAFLPGSQVDLRPVRNLEKLIGKRFKFKVIKFNKKRGNIVLSRRVLLETERQTLREKTLNELKEGVVRDGVVKNITEYGAFIDLGGIDGLLHITDMSWGRVNHPSEVFNVGDEVKVKVLKYDPTTQRVSLGLKQLQADPWAGADQRYAVSSRIQGRVVSLTDYGAFVELEQGIEGLIHVSEMSWTKRVKHPSKVVNVGDTVETMVLDIDVKNKRISLGMKQVEENPWTIVERKFPIGSQVRGQVKNITNFGIFVGIDEGIDGLVHISDVSWTQRIKHPSEMFKKGDEVEAIVLRIDKENERFSLGIKQLEKNPWENIEARYPVGSEVHGVVTNITDFGVFVKLEEGIDGLVYLSEISRDRVEDPKTVVKEGDEVTALVIKLDPKEQKIGLSMKAVNDKEARAELKQAMKQQSEVASSFSSLGDVLREKLAQEGRTIESLVKPGGEENGGGSEDA
ncbi:MAG: 30S ribosomal protein S1 [Deltaproteobacteria bacterium RBG_13_65_10]|nr:MAG: 30S ribosomal protein S1 [Deltaproteobacteria bacterium RBG_13_65_10]